AASMRSADRAPTPEREGEMKPDGSVQRVVNAAGDPAWLVSGYERVKELLGDPRISRSHSDPRHPVRLTQPALFGGPMGDPETERADHARMRRLLTRSFSARRMENLRPRVERIVEELLAEMDRSGPPADFHEVVAFPLPILVICELLGVPAADREDFCRWSDEATHMDHPARSRAGLQSLWRYIGALVERRHSIPGEDVISDLLEAAKLDPMLTDDAVAHIAAGLLFAGHQTAVGIIDRGAVLLLTHPEQREALQRDPGLAPLAVEEILRYPSPLERTRGARRGGGLPRYATVDIELDGVTIAAGDLVMFALQDANQDEELFPDPARFDITREKNPHLSFSHGLHFCLGAPLARMELQHLFRRLFQTFPTLRLAVPVHELRPIREAVAGRVAELPLSWRVASGADQDV
ncbi:MAG: cytochrome P450, partial [Actinomycetota bacterium]